MCQAASDTQMRILKMNLMLLFHVQPGQFDSACRACVMYHSLGGVEVMQVFKIKIKATLGMKLYIKK